MKKLCDSVCGLCWALLLLFLYAGPHSLQEVLLPSLLNRSSGHPPLLLAANLPPPSPSPPAPSPPAPSPPAPTPPAPAPTGCGAGSATAVAISEAMAKASKGSALAQSIAEAEASGCSGDAIATVGGRAPSSSLLALCTSGLPAASLQVVPMFHKRHPFPLHPPPPRRR